MYVTLLQRAREYRKLRELVAASCAVGLVNKLESQDLITRDPMPAPFCCGLDCNNLIIFCQKRITICQKWMVIG
jgi:hypothetical protein